MLFWLSVSDSCYIISYISCFSQPDRCEAAGDDVLFWLSLGDCQLSGLHDLLPIMSRTCP